MKKFREFSCFHLDCFCCKWCECNDSKCTGQIVLKFGVHITSISDSTLSWLTFQGHGLKVKVTASEKFMILLCLIWVGLGVYFLGGGHFEPLWMGPLIFLNAITRDDWIIPSFQISVMCCMLNIQWNPSIKATQIGLSKELACHEG